MPKTLSYTGELVVTSCWCGIQLALPSSLYRKMQADSKVHAHCPLGHTFVYARNEADQQRDRADEAERRLRLQRAATQAARDQAAAAHRSAIAYKRGSTPSGQPSTPRCSRESGYSDDPAVLDGIKALAHATLALVEQQRIANLIALVALSGNENVQESSFDEGSTLSSAGMHALIEYVRTPATPFSDPDDVPQIRADICKALGL